MSTIIGERTYPYHFVFFGMDREKLKRAGGIHATHKVIHGDRLTLHALTGGGRVATLEHKDRISERALWITI
ncbi:MAG TPA: hypothetical protein VFY61_01355 [Pyrinomonadaceae bacterium]|nr:hypothetical protein [Pyrinomonadaceae bacterium]